MSDTRALTEKIKQDDPVLVACVVFQTQSPEHLVQKIREAVTALAASTPACPVIPEITSLPSVSEDTWLRHSEAASYLGVSKSTLYHYSSGEQIERRKFGGRLEYRRSALDHFKQAHTLPAGCRAASARIIASAHSSGK
ncbi:MAG TPA: helix-turn-helix domain-containing protein [Candidatus Acidoferrum sp.]|nr:helix-turn-helix domain-containing protein [Candidatus Acidoferrum sp.]